MGAGLDVSVERAGEGGRAISDEQMPEWAQAMEARLEVREHHLLTEITEAISVSEVRLTRRLNEIHNEISVNMVRADSAHTKLDADRAEVASLREEIVGLFLRLREVEGRLRKGDQKPLVDEP